MEPAEAGNSRTEKTVFARSILLYAIQTSLSTPSLSMNSGNCRGRQSNK